MSKTDLPKNTPWNTLTVYGVENYLKTDENKVVNRKFIRWFEKMNECFNVCVKSDGCYLNGSTHKICKMNSPESYDVLNKLLTNSD